MAGRFWTESQNLTGSAPTLATQGMGLSGLKGYRLTVYAESTRTLSGAGNLRAYVYVERLAAWTRCPDNDVAVTASGVRYQTFPDFVVACEEDDRLYYVPDSVTVSAGTTVTVHVGGVAL